MGVNHVVLNSFMGFLSCAAGKKQPKVFLLKKGMKFLYTKLLYPLQSKKPAPPTAIFHLFGHNIGKFFSCVKKINLFFRIFLPI